MIRGVRTIFILLCAIGPARLFAETLDGTNGVFGPGSSVGSDRWFAGTTRSLLVREALLASPGELGPLAEDSCRKPPTLRGAGGDGAARAGKPAATAETELDRPLERGHRSVLARDLAGAVKEYRAAARLAADGAAGSPARPAFLLGMAHLARGEVCAAVEELKRAAKAAPSERRTRLVLGLALLWAGEAAEAQHELGVCSGADTEGLSDLLLGLAADARGEAGTALEAYRRYLARVDEPEVRRRCEGLRVAGSEAPPSRGREAEERPEAVRGAPSPEVVKGLRGSWRVLSSRLFYDQGGGGAQSRKATGSLEIEPGGVWRFGGRTGRWTAGSIGQRDWELWKISDYGPKRKITLEGWNGAAASGPIEESNGEVEFIWVIYRHQPDSGPAGDGHLKFGR